MKKSLAIMLFGAALVWGCTMYVHSARAADDVVGPAPKWKITTLVHDPDGDISLVYGSRKDGTIYFDNEKACKEALKSDKKLAETMKAVVAYAKTRKATVDAPECMLDVKPNEI